MSEKAENSIQAGNFMARQAALLEADKLSIDSTDLIRYQSRGRVAVIGGLEAMEFAPRLNSGLQPQVLLTEGEVEPGAPTIALAGRAVWVDGHLGAFNIYLGELGKPNYETMTVDLILDLSTVPLLNMPMKPPGYFHSPVDEVSLCKMIDALSGMIGTFEKPRYFDYDPSICAHGRSGQTACSKCIDACPAEAISSLAESIEVNPNLCQGGGVCASVCPSGAIRYTYPGAKDTLSIIRTLLRTYHKQGGKQPVLALFAESDGHSVDLSQSHILPVTVEELASVGLEVWLSALAYGAQAVLLVDTGNIPVTVAEALQEQITTAGEILHAMGYNSRAIRIVTPQTMVDDIVPEMPLISAAGFSGVGGKRQTAYLAIDHLYDQALRPKPMANLSVGAPFGAAYIEEESCTLCFACVGICPGKALQAGGEKPEIQFIEANCLQCGMCTRSCPENAIWITPRLLFDRATRSKQRLLYEEEPFCCSSCGKPFATRSVIDTMLTKLQGHRMFQDERARKRLTMCEDCRVVDIVQDPDAMEQAQNVPTIQ